MAADLLDRTIVFAKGIAIVAASIFVKSLYEKPDISSALFSAITLTIVLTFYAGNEALRILETSYRQRRDAKRTFCGLWINTRPEDPTKYGIYIIYFAKSEICVDGKVFDAIRGEWISSWKSAAVIKSTDTQSLAYLYSGEYEVETSDGIDQCLGFCRLFFSRSRGDFIYGRGYFVDDTHRVKSTNRDEAQKGLRTTIETEFMKVDLDFLKSISATEKPYFPRWPSSKPNWKDYKALAEAYHHHRSAQALYSTAQSPLIS